MRSSGLPEPQYRRVYQYHLVPGAIYRSDGLKYTRTDRIKMKINCRQTRTWDFVATTTSQDEIFVVTAAAVAAAAVDLSYPTIVGAPGENARPGILIELLGVRSASSRGGQSAICTANIPHVLSAYPKQRGGTH